jgi:dTDP-4-amino-4,6-dideoxygalactose transaminase
MEKILSISRQYGLRIIEDCAQSHGAVYKGRKTGAWGDIGIFSFYPTKNLGALADGGIMVTSDPEIAKRARLLREYGWGERYVSEIPGLNSRLDELQAAILRVKLRYLEEENTKRQIIADTYNSLLAETNLRLPRCSPGVKHVYHQYVVASSRREELRSYLKAQGIGTLVHYPVPIHLQPAYQGRLGDGGSFPYSEQAAKEVLSLPIFPELSLEQVRTIAEIIIAWEQRKMS